MIDLRDAELALNGARSALDNADSNLAWIKKSSLIERAYFLGLEVGLLAVMSEKDTSKMNIMSDIFKTLSPRSADDTFPSTRIGSVFRGLKNKARSDDDVRFSTNDLKPLTDAVAEMTSLYRQNRSTVDDILHRFERASLDEQRELLIPLEKFLRVISLLETDHLISARLEL